MAEHTQKLFAEALDELLRERQQPPPFKGVNRRAFFATIPGYSYEHLRRMTAGERTLAPEAIELMAARLEVEPEYFLEYRAWQIQEAAAL